MKKRVLVIGNTNMDLNISTDVLPEPERPAQNRRFEYTAGGNGSCAAVAFNKLGCDTVYSTRLGKDLNGQRLVSFFSDIGIDVRFIKSDKSIKTGFEICVTDADGTSERITYAGANRSFNSKDIEEAFTCYPDAVYVKSDINPAVLSAAANFAEREKARLFVSLGGNTGAQPLAEIKQAEAVFADCEAARDLCGFSPDNVEKCLRAAIAMAVKIRANYYIIRMEKRGSFVYDGKYYHVIAPYHVAEADLSAADDAFEAALTAKYLEKGDIKYAAKYAHAVYAYTASKEGLYTSVPTEAEASAFMAQLEQGGAAE